MPTSPEPLPFAPSPPSTDRVVHASRLVCVGLFRCPVTAPYFEDTGPIRNHVVVFPRRAVGIEPEGGPRVVASPNVVMFYNRGQTYRRRSLDEFGDASDWFAFAPEVLAEALAEVEPTVVDRLDAPFRATHAPSRAVEYLEQRRLVQALLAGEAPDPVAVDEACLDLLRRVLRLAVGDASRGSGRRPATRRARDALAAAACETLARRFSEGIGLDELAREVGASPYHLSRVFKERTGSTVHAYLDQLRLRAGLEALVETTDIATVGLSVGYSSHSHFTAAFRRAFGVTPSAYRARSRGRLDGVRARS
jgi:AraC-like DNA-binding protein